MDSERPDALDSGLFPSFDVLDDSSISVAEVNNELQFASVKNYFNAEEVEAALSLRVMKFAVAGSLEASNKSLESEKRAVSTSVKRLYASFNFTRLSLYLDEDVLEPSPQCKSALLKLRETGDMKEMQKFFDRFGHFFSKEVQLGGVMQCTCSMDQVQGENVAEKTNSLRHAAGSLFSGFDAKAGLAYGSQSLQSGTEGLSLSGSRQNLVWEARGGDTLLTSQPTAWAPTVKNYTNWRAIKRANVERLHLLIGRMPGWEWVPELFEKLTPLREEPTAENAEMSSGVELGTPRTIASDSSFAITALDNYPRKDITTYLILFQDAEGWVRVAGVFIPHETIPLADNRAIGLQDKTILFQDRIAEAQPRTPPAVTACCLSANPQQEGHGLARIEVFYLDRRGFLAEMEFNTTACSWNPGPLNGLSAVFDKPYQMSSLAASGKNRYFGSGCLRVELFYESESYDLVFLSRQGDAWAKVTNGGFGPTCIVPGSPLSIVHDRAMFLYAARRPSRVREYCIFPKDGSVRPPTSPGLEVELPLLIRVSDCRQFTERASPIEPSDIFSVPNRSSHFFMREGGTSINIFCELSSGSAEWHLISTRRDAKFVAIDTHSSAQPSLERHFKVVLRKHTDEFAFRIQNFAERVEIHRPPDVVTSFAALFKGDVSF